MSLTVMRPLSRPSLSTTGQLLDLVAVEDRLGLGERRADGRRDQVARRHQRGHRLRHVVLEAQVAVREDADEHVVAVRDRDAADVVAAHQRERVRHERVGTQRHRLDDHARLAALHLVDLGDLIRDREVAVDDAEAALARERDREARLGHGVHRRGDDRDREPDRRRQSRRRRDVVRQHVRLRRHEQHVVEREPFLGELLLEREEPFELRGIELDGHRRS